MAKKSFWDILAWIAFAWVVIYVILKILGILKSPVTVDLVTTISAAYFVGKLAQKIDYNTQKIDHVSKDVGDIKEDVRELNQKCPIFKNKIKQL